MRWASAPDVMDPPNAETLQALMVVQAARWMGVAPWELAERACGWLDLGLLGMEMERKGSASSNMK